MKPIVAKNLRTKLFTGNIEIDINNWFETNPSFEIIEIQYNCTPINNGYSFSALIVYIDKTVNSKEKIKATMGIN